MSEIQGVIPTGIVFGLIVFWLIASDPPRVSASTDNTAPARKIAPDDFSTRPSIRLRRPEFPATAPVTPKPRSC